MSKIIPSYASFDKGITKITSSKEYKELALPGTSKFLPSDSKIDSRLPQLLKANSLHNILQESLMPTVLNRENINPGTYQAKLQEAKKSLIEKLKEEKDKNKNKRRQIGEDEESDEELIEQLIEDFDELESNQELLWLLRQVVHLA